MVTLRNGSQILVGDGCLQAFKCELLIAFGEDADDWLLNDLQILIFTCEILAAFWSGFQVLTKHGLWTSLDRTLLALLKLY